MFCCQWPDFVSQNSLAGAFWQTNQINPAVCRGWVVLRLNTERVSYFNMCFRPFESDTASRSWSERQTLPAQNWTRAAVMGTVCSLVRCCLYSAEPHLSAGAILQAQHPTTVSSNLLVLQPLPVMSTCNKSEDRVKIQCAFLKVPYCAKLVQK